MQPTKICPFLLPWLVCAACAGADHAVLRAKPSRDAGADAATMEREDAGTASCDLSDDEVDEPVPGAPARDPEITRTTHAFFAIEVLDQDELPVAGARLRTVAGSSYMTDATGVAAFYEPDVMGSDVFFFVEADGYEMPEDGFGYRGRPLAVAEGERGELRMTRLGELPVANPDLGEAQRELLEGPVPFGDECFSVRVVDQESRRGVPLVFLRGESRTFISDSQGMVAICPPHPLPATLEVAVDSHGYAFSARSVQLDARAGGSATLELTRENVAERLYRVTGQGIYRDSYLLGLQSPRVADRLPGRVVQQDSVHVAEVDGERFWLWGYTDYPDYPLGNFFGSAARSSVQTDEGASYAQGAPELSYVTTDGKARPMGATLEPENLPTWLGPLIVARDSGGDARVFAAYGKPRGDLSIAARGLAELDGDDAFATATTYPVDDFVGPAGQALYVEHEDGEYVYFSSPVRIAARPAALRDTDTYERYTAFTDDADGPLARRDDGSLDYQFRAGAKPTRPEDLSGEAVDSSQSLTGHLVDVGSGVGIVQAGDGATARSEYRGGRFVRIFQQLGGVSSFAGEIWYAEADTPMGPWVYARKILTHDRYSFYAPFIQTSFVHGDGHLMYFEGSYTTALAGDDVDATPRYDRNQIAYRLDLRDPRLDLPVAVYDLAPGRGNFATAAGLRDHEGDMAPLFYAPDREAEGALAVHWSGPSCAPRRLQLSDTPTTPPLFYAFAPESGSTPSYLVPLYAFESDSGERAYALSESLDGYDREPEPFAYVWPSPSQVRSPVADYLPRTWLSAGSDQCVVLSNDTSEAVVAIEGQVVADGEGSPRHIAWTLDGAPCPIATRLKADVTLPVGVHTLTLEVELPEGRRLHDSIIVQVSARPSSE